jgi:hypothetical protein
MAWNRVNLAKTLLKNGATGEKTGARTLKRIWVAD